MSINCVSMLWTEKLKLFADPTTVTNGNATAVYMMPEAILAYRKLLSEGWKFNAVDHTRGRCYFSQRQITVPVWAMKKDTDYLEWYLCHEMSHAIAGHAAKHGPAFQKVLASICSARAVRYELTYKAREVVRAGIVLSCLLDED